LYEKETKIKEYMKIMGLSDSAYFASWIFHYNNIFVVLGLCMTTCIREAVFYNSGFWVVFFWQYLFYV